MNSKNSLHGLTIILLDDEEAILSAISRLFAVQGHVCHTALKGEEVLAKLDKVVPDLIILDIKIVGGLGGKETLKRIRQLGYELPVFSMSGYPAEEIFSDSITLDGFTAHLEKPFNRNDLAELIDKHCPVNATQR